jgi:transcriptional regulator with XRE-family HTH domain
MLSSMNIEIPNPKDMVAALQQHGLTQTEIGLHIGLSQEFVSNLKTGIAASIRLKEGLRLLSLYAERVLGRELALVPVRGKAKARRPQAARRCG